MFFPERWEAQAGYYYVIHKGNLLHYQKYSKSSKEKAADKASADLSDEKRRRRRKVFPEHILRPCLSTCLVIPADTSGCAQGDGDRVTGKEVWGHGSRGGRPSQLAPEDPTDLSL